MMLCGLLINGLYQLLCLVVRGLLCLVALWLCICIGLCCCVLVVVSVVFVFDCVVAVGAGWQRALCFVRSRFCMCVLGCARVSLCAWRVLCCVCVQVVLRVFACVCVYVGGRCLCRVCLRLLVIACWCACFFASVVIRIWNMFRASSHVADCCVLCLWSAPWLVAASRFGVGWCLFLVMALSLCGLCVCACVCLIACCCFCYCDVVL